MEIAAVATLARVATVKTKKGSSLRLSLRELPLDVVFGGELPGAIAPGMSLKVKGRLSLRPDGERPILWAETVQVTEGGPVAFFTVLGTVEEADGGRALLLVEPGHHEQRWLIGLDGATSALTPGLRVKVQGDFSAREVEDEFLHTRVEVILTARRIVPLAR